MRRWRPIVNGRMLVLGAVLVAGCGGSSGRTAAAGCQGLPTVRPANSFHVLFGRLARRATTPQVCRLFGAPRTITRGGGGIVTWHYGTGGRTATLSFMGDRYVGGGYMEPIGSVGAARSIAITS